MGIEFWRDLSIAVVFFEIALAVLIAIAAAIFLFIFTSRAMHAVGRSATKVRGLSRRAIYVAAKPLITVAAFITGFNETMRAAISSLRPHGEKVPPGEETMAPREKQRLGIGLSALLGVLGGLAIGFLYAPRSGKALRKSAVDKTRSAARKTEATIGKARANLSRLRQGRKPVLVEEQH